MSSHFLEVDPGQVLDHMLSGSTLANPSQTNLYIYI